MMMMLRLARQQHLSHGMAALSASCALLVSSGYAINGNEPSPQISRQRARSRRNHASTQICGCEKGTNATSLPTTASTTTPPPLSRLAIFLYISKLYPHSYLRTPRRLSPRDPLFSYPELNRGLRRRRGDEERLQHILREAREIKDQDQMNAALRKMNAVAYGEGITPQLREDWLMRYGCTGFTEKILQYLVETCGHRGIIEIGAGNGQWSRALSEEYRRFLQTQPINDTNVAPKSWEFVLAYDNMEGLPLSPEIYHKGTVPAKKHFFSNVQRASHMDAVQKAHGRALLLVYPPPGAMALETVLAYLAASPGYSGSYKNDTVVYVGEGRGGANADDAFFDYFLGCHQAVEDGQWVLEKELDVLPCPGGKGYEKMFVFRRVCFISDKCRQQSDSSDQ